MGDIRVTSSHNFSPSLSSIITSSYIIRGFDEIRHSYTLILRLIGSAFVRWSANFNPPVCNYSLTTREDFCPLYTFCVFVSSYCI